MATFEDIYALTTSLGGEAIAVRPERCLRVRHRVSSCSQCIDGCPAAAITIEANEVSIDHGRCIQCGACLASCPTEALVGLKPTDEELRMAIQQFLSEKKPIIFACARKDASHEGDPENYYPLPCLGRLNEATLLEGFAAGASQITLVDGQCATCKYHEAERALEKTLESTKTLLAATGFDGVIERTSIFPASAQDKRGRARKAARRGFFTDTKSLAKEVATKALTLFIEERMNIPQDEPAKPTMLERLGMAEYGLLPHFDATRNLRILDNLEALGISGEALLESRLFSALNLDEEACSGCGICVTFCPTHALEWGVADAKTSTADPETPVITNRLVEFSVADCLGCGLCADLCASGAVTLRREVAADELYELEPCSFKVPKAPTYRGGILDI